MISTMMQFTCVAISPCLINLLSSSSSSPSSYLEPSYRFLNCCPTLINFQVGWSNDSTRILSVFSLPGPPE